LNGQITIILQAKKQKGELPLLMFFDVFMVGFILGFKFLVDAGPSVVRMIPYILTMHAS
jgi:hypothetical protein